LRQCRDLVSDRLARGLPVVLDKLDDTLFDMANQPSDIRDQELYFETMREVRVKRANMEIEFQRRFKNSANDAIKRLVESRKSASVLDAPGLKLALLEDDDFEETLAVANMVQKIRTNCKLQLFTLEQRISCILKIESLKSEDNPFGPEIICNAFKDACNDVDAAVRIRLIVLKLFDRHVGSEFDQIYQEINDSLINQGVLPDIRIQVRNPPSHDYHAGHPSSSHPNPSGSPMPSAHQSGAHTVNVHAAPSGAQLLDALRQVMNVNFQAGGGAQSPGAQQMEVVNQLTVLQHEQSQAVCEEMASLDVSGVHTGTVNVLRDLKATSVTSSIGEIDSMMFDVVAMMFDFILDDKDMPAPMKALIGRLQIPMLKVAILDKAFFARKFHPARKLLNALADAAVGWKELQDDNDLLYEKMEILVLRVIEEFDERVDVFEDVLGELEQFLNEEYQRAEKTASVSADLIESRERLSDAKKAASEQLERRLAKAPVHGLVRDFLSSHWRELLFIRYFDEGETGEGWKHAVQTMDDLVWSVAPKTRGEDRNHLSDVLPGLLRRVRDGIKQLGMPTEWSAQFLGALKKLHIAAIRNEVCEGDPDTIDDSPGADTDIDDGSQLDLQSIDVEWSDDTDYSVEELSLVQLAVERANDIIYGTAETRPECSGMGTTLVAAQFHDNLVTIAHVGDARLYRLRNDSIEQLTSDHSLQQQLIDKGLYTPQEAREKVGNNVITRAIGADIKVDVEMQELDVQVGDLYLLCSDGLSDMVTEDHIFDVLRVHGADLAEACRVLVDDANEGGGEDNISAVLIRALKPFPDKALPREHELDMSEYLDIQGLTDVGQMRSHNEDYIAMDPECGIAIVADGMGGCSAGEVASEMAVKIVLGALRGGSADLITVTGGDGKKLSGTDKLSATAAAASAMLKHRASEVVIEGIRSDLALDPDDDDEYTAVVRDLDVGNWVEFHHGDTTSTRARLTWKSPVTGRYLFTDRKGLKVADSSIHGLAVELMRGSASLMEDVPLFDRIMSNITDHLRSGEARMH
jgi:serine/threonine protein phosphatase PrpC